MDILHFSIINGRDESLLVNAALYADEVSNYVLISNDSEDLEFWSKYIFDSTGVIITPFLLKNNAHLTVAHYFLKHMDFFKNKQIKYVDLKNCIITQNLDLLPFLSSLFINTQTCNISFLNINAINEVVGKVKDEIIILNNIYNALVTAKLNLLIGESSFPPQTNYNNVTGNEFSSLMLKEIKNKSFEFNNINDSGYLHVENTLKKIRSYLQNIFISIPSSSRDITGRTASNKYIQDGFPLVFKILSVIHYYSAKVQELKGNYNISFLHYIRSVECFIDGYLIIKTVGGFNALDEFIVDGKTRKGAGAKFTRAGDFDSLAMQPFFPIIDSLIKLRNKFFLTHGDMRVCDNIVSDFSRNISDLFSFIESNNQHINFKWSAALKEIEEVMDINIVDFIYYSLVGKYEISGEPYILKTLRTGL